MMAKPHGPKRKPDRSYFIARSLAHRAMLANKPPKKPSPTVQQLADGRWAVIAPDGAELTVLATNAEAWAWLDRP